MTDETATTEQRKQNRKRGRAKTGIVATFPVLTAMLVNALDNALVYDGDLMLVSEFAAVKAILSTVAMIVLAYAYFVYDIEQLPDEVNAGVIRRLILGLSRVLRTKR